MPGQMKTLHPQKGSNSTATMDNNSVAPQPNVEVIGARVHNLKNINVTIPHDKLTVITGVSGSGKSSLAFDTIYAEGQRRYIETFSAYARHLLGSLDRPDVDSITGLSPVISIEQKTTNRNPRSTIGTTTEIYDFLRLLYARVGQARSYISGQPMVKYTVAQIVDLILSIYNGQRIYILAPLVKNRKGHYKELFETLIKKGYLRVRVDGELRELQSGIKLTRYQNHSIELVVDRMRASGDDARRLAESVEQALKMGGKMLMVADDRGQNVRHFSQMLMDAENGISYHEPAPHNFSFNSPQGACPRCKGLGYVSLIDHDKLIPNPAKSIYEGGIEPLGKYKNNLLFWQIEAICKLYGCTIKTPISSLPDECVKDILEGTDARLHLENATMSYSRYSAPYTGLLKYIEMQQDEDAGAKANKWSGQFYSNTVCPDCHGARLNREALHFFIDDKNIAQVAALDIDKLYDWTTSLPGKLSGRDKAVAREILKEINARLHFLIDVGLHYLSLARPTASLSGGESQRIRLATQIGSQLVNVLYILDEPSIGLHQRDNVRLINSLCSLRDIGNTVIVVEHDRDIMLRADHIIDIGPGAGASGGNVLFQGSPAEMLHSDTLTAQNLTGRRTLPVPASRREGNGLTLSLLGATGNNLKDVNLHLLLGKLIVVTGVSGSGKSSLINGTLKPIISQALYHSLQEPLPYKEIKGLEHIDKLVSVDQRPLGRSPRSNPATFTGLFADIRKLFVALPEAQIRGYKPGRFSFNVSGGRCETCKGNGYRTIEMNFLPDVLVPCEDCHGKRYNRETLEVRFKGKSIADVLEMTVDRAADFFSAQPHILRKLRALQDVGLGYLTLGQPSSTLSGGENQRVKLAAELAKKATGRTLFLLDEPTTGLHFEDIRVLMDTLSNLADKGNTLLIIEHNMDVIKLADHIIDMGPEGGQAGGRIIGEGTPEQIAQLPTPTGNFLRAELTPP